MKAEIRVDAGFAVPTLYEYCEKEGIDYTIGLISNARLEALAASLLEEANERCEAEGRKARIFPRVTTEPKAGRKSGGSLEGGGDGERHQRLSRRNQQENR